MFRQRVITSAIIVPLVLGILFSGLPLLQLAFGAFVLAVCGWEWGWLIPLPRRIFFFLYSGSVLVLSAIAMIFGNAGDFWFWLTIVSWGLIIIAILSFPASRSAWARAPVIAAAGLIILPLFFHALTVMMTGEAFGPALLMYTILLVWAADVGAYMTGKLCGRHKLIPRVSPGKSWEGVLGGMVLVLLVALAGARYFQPQALVCWYLTALLLAVQSVFGDLFISMLKRNQQLKDTGNILPGHGGMLDRLDSLLAVTPLAVILYTYCFSTG